MSEQEKTEVEVKKSTYFCDWNGSSWTFKRPDGEAIETRSDLLNELGALLARAEKAEAESDELMRKLSEARVKEHWEANEVERQLLRRAEAAEAERDELKRKLSAGEGEKLDLVKLSAVDWNRVRIDAAIAAMQALLPDIREFPYSPEWVVQHADALVAELKKEVTE